MAGFLLCNAWWSRKRFLSCLVFVTSVLTLLSLSGVYHMMELGSTSRAVMLRLDVAAVFVLIAGTFTPVHVIMFRGWNRWGILTLLWLIAIVGVTLRSIFFNKIPSPMGSFIFLSMGWIGLYTAYLIYHRLGWQGFRSVLFGGICYSVGAIINVIQWPIIIPLVWGPHETFHFMVLAGLGFHWSFISKIAQKPQVADDEKNSDSHPEQECEGIGI